MRVAALQFQPTLLEVDANLATIERELSAADADLVVLPELCTTGYFFPDATALAATAETLDGRSVQLLRDHARSMGCTIVAGLAERAGERLFNSAITVTADGALHLYRKVHLFAEENILFTPGDLGFPVVDIGACRLGVMICYDWRFPEAARTLALRGAQIIAHPSDLVAAPSLWQPVMRTRSVENRVATVTANRIGTETRGDDALTFHGHSQIVAHNGNVLAETDEHFQGWIRAEVDPAASDRKAFSPWNDIFADRRPDQYAL